MLATLLATCIIVINNRKVVRDDVLVTDSHASLLSILVSEHTHMK